MNQQTHQQTHQPSVPQIPFDGFANLVPPPPPVEETPKGELGTITRNLLSDIADIESDTAKNEFDARLEQARILHDLENRDDVQAFKGGLPRAIHQVLGWKPSKISKQRLVAEHLIKPLGLATVEQFEMGDFAKLYYAARALKKRILNPATEIDGNKLRPYTPLEALQRVETMTRNQAAAWSRDEIDRKLSNPLVALPWKIDQAVADALERGVNRFIDITGFGKSADAHNSLTQALERLAEYLESAHEEKLLTLEREAEDGTAQLEPSAAKSNTLAASRIDDTTIELAWNAGRTRDEIKKAFGVGSTRAERVRKNMMARGWQKAGDWDAGYGDGVEA